MELFPENILDQVIQQIVKKKLQAQLDAMYPGDPDAQEEYVEEYIDSAGDEFKEGIEDQVTELNQEFAETTEDTTKLITSMAAVPPVAASPFTVSASNQMVTTIIGDTKAVAEKISKIMAKVTAWIGGAEALAAAGLAAVTAAMDTVSSSLEDTLATAEESYTLVEEEIPETIIDSTIQDPTIITWTYVDPAISLTPKFEGYDEDEGPDGITWKVNEETKELIITCDTVLLPGTYNYTVTAEYTVSGEMEQDGTIPEEIKTKEYNSSIIKQ